VVGFAFELKQLGPQVVADLPAHGCTGGEDRVVEDSPAVLGYEHQVDVEEGHAVRSGVVVELLDVPDCRWALGEWAR